MIRSSLFLLCLLYASMVAAQEFRYKADIEQNAATAFYNIQLGPDVRAKAQLDLRDVRISDGKGRFVPFVVLPEEKASVVINFKEFPIVSNTTDTAGNTILVIETGHWMNLDQINLIVRNHEVSRAVNIDGSNNNKDWYAVKENVLVSTPISNGNSEQLVHTIPFLPIDYKYVRLTIYNEHKSPLSIIKAGIFSDHYYRGWGNMINPPLVTKQKDSSDGYSYIYIEQEDTYLVDFLRISCYGTRFFDRGAQLYVLKDSTLHTASQVANFTLSSTGADRYDDTIINRLELSQTTRSKNLLLKIYNGDNPPLQITTVLAYHKPALLCAYLEKGKHYHLLFGNDSVSAPIYDLDKFRDSIPADATKLMHSAITIATANDQMKERSGNKRLLWAVIVGVVILLGFFSWKLVGEMNNKNEQ